MYFSVAQCVHVRLVGTGLGPVGDWGPDMQRAMGGGGGSVVCGVSSTVVLASSSKWRGGEWWGVSEVGLFARACIHACLATVRVLVMLDAGWCAGVA